MTIILLPPTLINQIAAGEVICRPASVAKELIENSIDAGASRITIGASEDARDITVTDDGCGMMPDDAPLSFQRHTTSKIATLDDIIHIKTRGFRGEALASIAAVSRLTLTTRTPDDLAATRIMVEGGEVVKSHSVGAPIGTSVAVRELFFNTPARLKFMRRPSTELKRVLQVTTQQALSHPEIGFTFLKKGRKQFEFPAKQSLKDRLRQVLGSAVEGMLLSLESGNLPVTVHGFIARPEAGRNNRGGQFFFVNRRPIANRILTIMLEQAYRGLMMTGRHPVGAIFVFLEPEEVDVNVHPTKEEVRFRDERKVGGIVYRVVSEALRKANLVPYTRLPASPGPAVTPSAKGYEGGGLFSSPAEALRESFKKEATPVGKQDDLGITASRIMPAAPSPPPPDVGEVSASQPRIVPQTAADFWAAAGEPEPLGQIADTYIVALCGDALLLIDQHAAHERIMYEKIAGQEIRSTIQQLLIPITFEVEVAEVPQMERLVGHLAAFGIEVEPFGGRTFIVHSLPADIGDVDAPALIRDILNAPDINIKPDAASELRDEIAKRLACHSAIKAGQRLSPQEMRRLISDLKKTQLAFTCPHGRPTMILLTKSQLDRQFKRIT